MITLTEAEINLIKIFRKAQEENHFAEHVFLVRYIPVDFEGSFIQQVLAGKPQNIFQLRGSANALLADLNTLPTTKTFFSIVRESPEILRFFEH